ncbi:MAG: hypothetical protein WD595_06170 [Waddliaceae bacterium]
MSVQSSCFIHTSPILSQGPKYLPLIRGTWCLGWGIREFVVSGRHLNSYASSVSERVHALFSHHLTQGAWFFLTGSCNVLTSLHDFKVINVGVAFTPLLYIGGFSFIMAQIQNFDQSYQRYQTAHQLGDSTAMKFAVLGMLSATSYLFMALIAAFSTSFAITFLLGIFAFNTGMLEIYIGWYQSLRGV